MVHGSAARTATLLALVMSSSTHPGVTVVLVGLPGFYKGMLEAQFRQLDLEQQFTVHHLTPDDQAAVSDDSVIVVAANPRALRRATLLVGRSRILGTVAVTDEAPKGDLYLVDTAGTNVSDEQLAKVIRQIAANPMHSPGTHGSAARLIRSDS